MFERLCEHKEEFQDGETLTWRANANMIMKISSDLTPCESGCGKVCNDQPTPHCQYKPYEYEDYGNKPLNSNVLTNCQRHIRTHTVNGPFEYKRFLNHFDFQHLLVIHQETHNAENLYQYKEYRKTSAHGSSRHTSGRSQSVRKHYQCNICGRHLSSSTSRGHEKFHSVEKLCECKECGKAFTFPHTLELHKKIHTGEKNYVCEQCGKALDLTDIFKYIKKNPCWRKALCM